MQTIILVIHILLALGITVLVLLQRSEGGALGALGGSQGASGLFTGRQAGNILTRLTTYLFIGFVCTSLTLVIMAKNATIPEEVNIVPVETVTTEVTLPTETATAPVETVPEAVPAEAPVAPVEAAPVEAVPAETPVAPVAE